MKPSFVVKSLSCLMTVSTITYLFLIPPALLEPSNAKNLPGYWGEPTGEFDWCESNYRLAYYIAEPWNTFTGLSYTVMAFVLTLYYKQLEYRNDINLHSMFLSLIVILPLLGFATSLFHATLQYEHQLLDKMGMHLLVSYASASVFVRCDPKSWIYHIAMAFSSVLSTAMWLTRNDRHGFPHQFVTRLAITSFSVMFVYIFYGGASMSQKSSKQCESLFDSCYAVWVGSVLFWLMDNFLCDILQNEMTAFIPYLNYHGTAWHLGSCLGCNYLLHVFMGYGLEKQQGVEIQIEWFCVIFPYITIPSQKKKL